MSELESAKYWLSWIEIGGTVAVALVAIGVTMEFAETWLARPLRHKVELAHDEEIGRLAKAAAEATERAVTLAFETLKDNPVTITGRVAAAFRAGYGGFQMEFDQRLPPDSFVIIVGRKPT